MAMCQDKAFIEEAEKLGIDMSPIDGEADLEAVGAHCGDTERRIDALQRDRAGRRRSRVD